MSKLVSVWGSPGAGKTTFAIKLANAYYEQFNGSVAVVMADIETPMLPVICANEKKVLPSLGELLSHPGIGTEDVLKSIVMIKGRDNYGLMGFTGRDNRNMYPEYDRAKAREVFRAVSDVADVIIVDCTSALHDVLSDTAMRDSDVSFRIVSPDMKSLSFLTSQLPLYSGRMYHPEEQIVVLNNPGAAVNAPVEEAKAYLGRVDYEIPFSRYLAKQFSEGTMLRACREKRMRELFGKMAEWELTGGKKNA